MDPRVTRWAMRPREAADLPGSLSSRQVNSAGLVIGLSRLGRRDVAGSRSRIEGDKRIGKRRAAQ